MAFRSAFIFLLSLGLFASRLNGESSTNVGQKGNLAHPPSGSSESKPFWSMNAADSAAWATAVGGIANIILVVYIFFRTDKAHKIERINDFKDRETERKAKVACFWIEELIMRQHHEMLSQFFDEVEQKLKNQNSQQPSMTPELMLTVARDQIIQFKEKLFKIQHQIIEPLRWIHNDFQDLIAIRNDIEDLVTEELSKIPGIATGRVLANPDNKMPVDRLADLRKNFFQTIHKVHTNVLLSSTHQS